jgi:hypothetical protein
MQTQLNTELKKQKLGSLFVNIGLAMGIATMAVGLISCSAGNSPAATTTASTTPTITSVYSGAYVGIVASSVAQALTIYGSNFTNGMSINLQPTSGVTNAAYMITASSVIDSGTLAVSAVISAVPSDHIIVFAIKSSGTTLASGNLGVAGTRKVIAEIKTIFADAGCTACHSNNGSAGLNLTDNNSIFAYGNSAYGCSSMLRIAPGDARRSSSLIIDKITSSGVRSCSSGPLMGVGSYGNIVASQVQAVVDWVAGGARN